MQGDVKFVLEKYGISHTYFPGVEKTKLPIYFGLIGNPDIIGLSEEGKELTKIDGNIYPDYVERKPIKGYE